MAFLLFLYYCSMLKKSKFKHEDRKRVWFYKMSYRYKRFFNTYIKSDFRIDIKDRFYCSALKTFGNYDLVFDSDEYLKLRN